MQVATRPYVLAAAALAATSVVTVTPFVSQTPKSVSQAPKIPVVSMETRLVDADSIANIPYNLFQDIVNIPYNEIQALNTLADSEFFTGNWFVVSATNLWGVDPGDPSHFMSVMDLLLPFPALSGMGAPETDFDAGLGQQLWGAVAAELPVNSACDAMDCLPQVPTPPITGITSIDSFIWDEQILTGGQQFPLIDHWFQVPLTDLFNGYEFSPDLNGSTDPSGPVVSGFGFLGTGEGDSMPWSGDTYTLQPWVPVENFINSLEATPNPDGFEIPTLTEAFQALQSVFAGGIVDFDPFTPGSPFCLGTCEIPDAFNYPALVQDVANLMPNNPTIDTWLTDFDTGAAQVTYNGPTEEQILNSINILQQGYWDFGNPYPPAGTGPDFTEVASFFHQFWLDLGITPGEGVDAGGAAASAAADSFDPSALLAGSDPTTISADLSTLLAGLGTTLSTDLATLLPSLF